MPAPALTPTRTRVRRASRACAHHHATQDIDEDAVAKVKAAREQLKKKGGHEKPWRAVPGGISTRPVISVVEKDLSRQYRGKV